LGVYEGRGGSKLNKIVFTDNGKERLVAVDSEIDIVAVDAKARHYILCECNFRNSETDIADFERLKEKSILVQKGANIKYAFFSKSGFTKELTEQANKNENILLFSLTDIMA
jgi:hypothetical protein